MVGPARPRSYLDFEKEKAAAAARRHYRGLTWLGRARRTGGAPDMIYYIYIKLYTLYWCGGLACLKLIVVALN